jgi:uncharacterized membrane protein
MLFGSNTVAHSDRCQRDKERKMPVLIAGIVLWVAVHLVPALAPGVRQGLIARLGAKRYKGVFALSIVAALVLIVIGWRASAAELIYPPPSWGRLAAFGLMPISIYLFGAAQRPAMIKRIIRHPQLTGLLLWSVAHLLANGDQRSLVLFGGLGAWAVVEMLAINRRDGAWIKQEAPTFAREALGIVISLALFGVLVWAHQWFAGVPLIAR